MLDIHSLRVAYNGKPILKDISLSVQAGEVLAVIGPNGAGKTTLIRAASGVLPHSAGQILVGGEGLYGLGPRQRARQLAVVPQARYLPGSFSVEQTVLLGRTAYLGWLGTPQPQDTERAEWALERAQLTDLRERRLDQLSGGEQQRVLLARALAQGSPLLLLDEPTTHLDLQYRVNLIRLIHNLAHEEGLAVLMAMHDLNLVAQHADRVLLLVDGWAQAIGSPVEVLTSENLSVAYGLPVNVIPHPEYGTPLVLPEQ